MAQLIIVTTPQNSGDGTPLSTAFNYCNSNFGELYARFQVNPPATLVGTPGDQPGFYASDADYFYYCFAEYDGSSVIWARVTQVGNITVPDIQSGTSNIQIAEVNGNATVNLAGTSNVAVFSVTGIFANTQISATGNISGGYFLGNGSQLTGLPATYTDSNVVTLLGNLGSNSISTSGNVVSQALVYGAAVQSGSTISASGNVSGNYIKGNGSLLTNLPVLYNDSNVAIFLSSFGSNTISTTGDITGGNLSGDNLLTSGTVSATGNITGGNLITTNDVISQGVVSAVGNIITDGYFVGTFVGNVTGNFVVPGSNTQVIFNTSGNADAVGGFTYNKGSNTLTVLGVISSQGNVIGGNLVTTGQVSATGNITGGNASVTGLLTSGSYSTAGTITGGNLTTGGNLSVSGSLSAGPTSITGNINSGNILSTGIISTTGNISTTANVFAYTFYGISASLTGSITSTIITGNSVIGNSVTALGTMTAANVIGTISTPSQPLITTVGTLGSLSVTGNIQVGNVRTVGSLSSTGNVLAGNAVVQGNISTGGNISANNYSGTNITAGNVSTSGLTAGNISVVNLGMNSITGNVISVAGNITGNYIIGNGSLLTGLAPTYTDANVAVFLDNLGANSIQTTSSIAAEAFVGNTYTGNTITANNIGANSAVVSGNINANNSLANAFITPNTLVNSGVSTTGNIIGGNVSVGSGSVTVGNIVASGNVAGNIGSSSKQFNTIFAKATSAQYADLAEKYTADAEYTPGTVVIFGGTAEITTTTQFADVRVAGAISTDPAYLMNSGSDGLSVALRGRIPVNVIGPVNKGDLLVTASNNPGYAVSVGQNTDYPLAVFAKSIETNTDEGVKVITAVII